MVLFFGATHVRWACQRPVPLSSSLASFESGPPRSHPALLQRLQRLVSPSVSPVFSETLRPRWSVHPFPPRLRRHAKASPAASLMQAHPLARPRRQILPAFLAPDARPPLCYRDFRRWRSRLHLGLRSFQAGPAQARRARATRWWVDRVCAFVDSLLQAGRGDMVSDFGVYKVRRVTHHLLFRSALPC